jgi:hypothetical protein
MPRENVETASLTYRGYKLLSRGQQLKPLITKVVEDASEEEVSMLKAYLEWMVRQGENRGKVRRAS